MKRVAEAFDMARLQLFERLTTGPRDRSRRFPKAQDEVLLPLIHEVVQRTADLQLSSAVPLLKHRLVAMDKPRVNHKCVHHIMRHQGLLLTWHTGNRLERSHDGTVITQCRILPWSANAFEVGCFNGEKIRIVFVLDCYCCEIIGFTATACCISNPMVHDLCCNT